MSQPSTETPAIVAEEVHTGICELPVDFFQKHQVLKTWSVGGNTLMRVKGSLCPSFAVNTGLHFTQSNGQQFLASVEEVAGGSDVVVLRLVPNYMDSLFQISGITARNVEQCFLLDAILNPKIDLVIARGVAGSGKTLVSMAGATYLVRSPSSTISGVTIVRTFVSISNEIGFLPGTKQDKISPWMRAVSDNMPLLRSNKPANGKGRKSLDPHAGVFEFEDMGVMQGSSLHNRIVFIDEAQNLTKKQMAIMLTRAGEGSKVILLGNKYCVDTKTSYEFTGLAHAWNSAKGWEHATRLELRNCERSRLARWANMHF